MKIFKSLFLISAYIIISSPLMADPGSYISKKLSVKFEDGICESISVFSDSGLRDIVLMSVRIDNELFPLHRSEGRKSDNPLNNSIGWYFNDRVLMLILPYEMEVRKLDLNIFTSGSDDDLTISKLLDDQIIGAGKITRGGKDFE